MITAVVNGQTVYRGPGEQADSQADSQAGSPLDSEGRTSLTFHLPKTAPKKNDEYRTATVTVAVVDGAKRQQATRTVPLLTPSVDVSVFPEGGDLVEGVAGRVYVQATLPSGEPADLTDAAICKKDANDECLATVSTEHMGRGVSSLFVPPAAGDSLELRIHGVGARAMPTVTPHGGTITMAKGDGVVAFNEDLEVEVSASQPGALLVAVSRREHLLAAQRVEIDAAGAHRVTFDWPSLAAEPFGEDRDGVSPAALEEMRKRDAQGVLRVTLFRQTASGLQPLAERLVFRQPRKKITFDVQHVRPRDIFLEAMEEPLYEPAGRVRLEVTATVVDTLTGETEPADAVLGASVTDMRTFALSRAREQPPFLPTQAFLEGEVWDLDDARAYLRSLELDAAAGSEGALVPQEKALGLLLGTQGWRRFAYMNATDFLGNGERGRAWHTDAEDDAEALKNRKEALLAVHEAGRPVMMPMMMARGDVVALRAGAMPEAFAMDGAEVEGFAAVADLEMAAEPAMAMVGGAGAMADEMAMDDAAEFEEGDEIAPQMKMADGAFQGADEGFAMGMPPPPFMDQNARVFRPPPTQQLRYVRQYAHAVKTFTREEFQDGPERSDFTETVLWVPGMCIGGRGGGVTAAGEKKAQAGRASRSSQQQEGAVMRKQEEQHAHRVEAGKAFFDFGLSDSVTAFRVHVDAFGQHEHSGAYGAFSDLVVIETPLSLTAELPQTITRGDSLLIPVVVEGLAPALPPGQALRRRVPKTELDMLLHAEGDAQFLDVTTQGKQSKMAKHLEHGGETRLYFPIVAEALEAFQGDASLSVHVGTSEIPLRQDRLRLATLVLPSGFPECASCAGMLAQSARCELAMPLQIVPGSVNASVYVFPSPIGNLNKALESLVHEPCGCFEQTSSTTYPLVLALKLMQKTRSVRAQTIDQAKKHLTSGYAKLVGFGSEGGGYEWFGGTPGHEALTSMGLLQFVEMGEALGWEVVDLEMIEMTRRWLVSRRDGPGHFARNPRALDSYGRAPDDVTDAYILYAVTEAAGRLGKALGGAEGLKEVRADVLALWEKLGGAGAMDSYTLGLMGNIFMTYAKAGDAAMSGALDDVAAALMQKQDEGGGVAGAKTSITSSQGRSLQVETTSLAVLFWVSALGSTAHSVDRGRLEAACLAGVRFLASQTKNGMYGNTQATALGLKALVAYLEHAGGDAKKGTVSVLLNGDAIATAEFAADAAQVHIPAPDIAAFMESYPGSAVPLELRLEQDQSSDSSAGLPYLVDVAMRTPLPRSAEGADVKLTQQLLPASGKISESDPVTIAITVENTRRAPAESGQPSDEAAGVGMAVASIGIPSGLTVRHARLKELQKSGAFDFFELKAPFVHFYWRGLEPGAAKRFEFDAAAELPGVFQGQASSAYVYYDADKKSWAPGLNVDISPLHK